MMMHRTDLAITLRAVWATVLSLATILPSLASPIADASGNLARRDPRGRTQPPAWIAFKRAWTGIVGYSATVTIFEKKGAQTQHVVFDYNFRKPSSATVHVVQGPNAGVTLVWNGGSTMAAHRGSGLIAQFKRTLSLHDPLATTIRGSSIDQLSFGAILTHARQTPGTVSQSPGPLIDGVPTDAVKLIPTASATDAGLTHEVVDISKRTYFPMRVLGYNGGTLVRRIDFSNVKLERQ
jgi:outer membrane lipoprotein-sorting protein